MRQKRPARPKLNISDAMANYLLTGARSDLDTLLSGDGAVAWESARGDLLEEHRKKSPGTRPWAWWKFDAPEPRQRIGGRGTLRSEVFAGWKPILDFGIPRHVSNWIIAADVRLGAVALPVNSENTPTFESEAAFLKRHGLLLPAEEKRSDFEPEVIR